MIVKTCLLSLPFALLIGTAAAQTGPWPIVNGRQPQATELQVESKQANKARERDVPVQPEIDRLYDEIMRAAKPQ
jgi:hypothetical protein